MRIPTESQEWLKSHHLRKERGKMEWRIDSKAKAGKRQDGETLFHCQVRTEIVNDELTFKATIYASEPVHSISKATRTHDVKALQRNSAMERQIANSKPCMTARQAVWDAFGYIWHSPRLFDQRKTGGLNFYPDFFNLCDFEDLITSEKSKRMEKTGC